MPQMSDAKCHVFHVSMSHATSDTDCRILNASMPYTANNTTTILRTLQTLQTLRTLHTLRTLRSIHHTPYLHLEPSIIFAAIFGPPSHPNIMLWSLRDGPTTTSRTIHDFSTYQSPFLCTLCIDFSMLTLYVNTVRWSRRVNAVRWSWYVDTVHLVR